MSDRLFYFYLAILCWVPLPLASHSALGRDIFILLTCVLTFCCCIQLLQQKNTSLPKAFIRATPVYALFALALLWGFMQTIPLPYEWINTLSPARAEITGFDDQPEHMTLSFYPWGSRHSLLLGISYLLLFALTTLLISNESRLRQLLYTLAIIGTLQGAYAALMTLSGLEKQLWFDKEAHIGMATGTLLNRNHLANYLTYCAAAAIGLILSSSRVQSIHNIRQLLREISQWLLGNKGALRLSLLVMVIAMILTRSRMGNIAFFISLISTALVWLLLSRKFNKTTAILFASLLIVDMLLVGTLFGAGKIAERIQVTNPETELRFQMMPDIVTMAKDFTVVGTGLGTFADVFPLYKTQMTTTWLNEAHNDYLQFLIELGLIGTLPLILIVLLSLRKTYHTIRLRKARLLVATSFSILMALSASGIHAFVEYNLQRPATTTLFIVFLALPWVCAHIPSEQRKHKRKRSAS